MNLKLSQFVRDKRQALLRASFAALLVWAVVWAVREITCDWSCEASRAAERHVDALADNDYDSYAANVSIARIEDFEFQRGCLDWNQAKTGEVYDSLLATDLKSVALYTPSGDFFLATIIRNPVGNDLEGKGFMVSVAPDACPADLGPLLRSIGQDE